MIDIFIYPRVWQVFSSVLNVPVITRIKDHGYALENNCQTQPKCKQFIEFDSEDNSKIQTGLDCHTRPQRSQIINKENTKDCHSRPQLSSNEAILKQAILNTIRNKVSPKIKKQKTPNKIQQSQKSPTCINKLLKQSPKAKSIKKPDRNKVKNIVREFEGKIAHENRNNSPLRQSMKSRAGGRGRKKGIEVQSNQADIRSFLERRTERDSSPKKDWEIDRKNISKYFKNI